VGCDTVSSSSHFRTILGISFKVSLAAVSAMDFEFLREHDTQTVIERVPRGGIEI